MAFQGSSRRYPCWDCQREFTWFALINSDVIREEPDAKAAAASSSREIIELARVQHGVTRAQPAKVQRSQ